MRKRIRYSQNFLKNKSLIRSLIEKSSIRKGDIVYEIGAGQGIITEELLKKKAKVIAFEIDENLYKKLSQRFQDEKSLDLKQGNFLDFSLPKYAYKVFSNIPFNISSAVVKKLTFSDSLPEDTYLIIQKEAAKKFIGMPLDKNNSLLSLLIKSRLNTTIFHQFNRSDFLPKPNVDVVMIQIQKLQKPYVLQKNTRLFFDFVTYAFNQFKPNILEGLSRVMGKNTIKESAKEHSFSTSFKPSLLEFKYWVALFEAFLEQSSRKQKSKVQGVFNKLQKQQESIQKIHRTRVDKDWKKFS